MFMPRVVVLWHRTGFIRRHSLGSGGASATILSRATPYSTWQDDFSYDKYSDRAAPAHSRRSAADANNIRRRRDDAVKGDRGEKGNSNRLGCSLKDWLGVSVSAAELSARKIIIPYTYNTSFLDLYFYIYIIIFFI